MTTIPGESIALLQLALELAVDQLTEPDAQQVEQGGELVTVRLPCLLTQVAEAVEDNSGPAAAAAARSKPPLRLDALALLDEIDRMVGIRSGEDRSSSVRGWAGRAHALTQLGDLDAVREQAERWVARARAVLDPSPPRVLRGVRCPACLRTTTSAIDASGEEVQRPPLEVDAWTGGARCVATDCDARWSVNELAALADQSARVEEQIRRQTAHEHLAHEETP